MKIKINESQFSKIMKIMKIMKSRNTRLIHTLKLKYNQIKNINWKSKGNTQKNQTLLFSSIISVLSSGLIFFVCLVSFISNPLW